MARSVGQKIRSVTARIIKIAGNISVAMIIGMMLITVTDVVLRKFGSGIAGAVEINEILLVAITFFALAHCWNKDGHIRVDLFVDLFSPRFQAAANAFSALIGFCFFGAVMWGGAKFAIKALKMNEVSTTLKIPLFPAKLILVIGTFLFCFQLLISFIVFIRQTLKKPELTLEEK